MALFMIMVIRGPSAWDRLLGLNLIATKTIVAIVIYSSVHDSSFLLDFAIVYALFGFIGTIFVALFLSERQKKKRQQLQGEMLEAKGGE